MAIKKRKMALRFMAVCLGILLMIPALVACGVRQKGNIGQTVGDESETAEDEKNSIDEVMIKDDLRPQTNISTIRITDGTTGQDMFLTKESNSEYFWEIIAKWEKLDVEKSENQTQTVGYVYWLRLEDEEGAELHSIVPGEQEIQIDGVKYHDYSMGTAMELFLAVDAAWAKMSAEKLFADMQEDALNAAADNAPASAHTQPTIIEQKPSDFQIPDNIEGVTMEVTYATSRGANLVFSNDTNMEIQYGDDYSLQAYVDGAWYNVGYIIDNAAFNAIAYPVPQNGTGSWGVRWIFFHGELPPGHYRIVKSVMDFRGTGDYTTYQLAAEFTVE